MATVHTRTWHVEYAMLPTIIRGFRYSQKGFRGWDDTLYIILYGMCVFLFFFFYIIFSNVRFALDARARLHARSRGIRNAIRPA